MQIRRGRPDDLPALLELETACFEEERRDSPKVFRHSMGSPFQEIWIAEEDNELLGSLFLRFHPHTCRIHSIAVSPSARGRGIGARLLEKARARARARGCARMSLEADARNSNLLHWYQQNGYKITKTLPDYYTPGWHGCRLTRNLRP
ncbi:MAG: GNAT family N-acetyltransferase [Oceanipulchritudo sp.]